MLNSSVIFVSVLNLTIGFCTITDAFALDLEENLNQLQEDLLSAEIRIKKKFIDFIRFHSEARELVLISLVQ